MIRVEDITVVIAYYNENLEWVKILTDQCKIPLKNILLLSKLHKSHAIYNCIHLPNTGRDAHSFMYYVKEFYFDLPKILMFCPGSVSSSSCNHLKFKKFVSMLNQLHTVKQNGIVAPVCDKFEYDFTLDEWSSSDPNNYNHNQNKVLIPAVTRPFGKWYQRFVDSDFTKIVKFGLSYNFIFTCSKESLHKRPLSFYESILNQLIVGENLEVIHYVERIMYSLFVNMQFVEIKFYD